jgi:hypothetical protein
LLNTENSNRFLTLYQAAQGYLSLGFNVIPVHVDPGRAKVAAVAWKPYQQRLAKDAELRTWFLEQRHPGIAIVTGTISNLMVLDFDDPHIFERFCYAYPELRQTYTVRTRRGQHLYYHIPKNCPLHSRKGQGIDLQADGSYVVAPPTIIDGHSYYVRLAVPPRTLSLNELAIIGSFFDRVSPGTPASIEKSEPSNFLSEIQGVEKDCFQSSRQLLTVKDLQYLYGHLVQKGSRNEALFRVSLKARDEGWCQEQVVAALGELHVQQPATGEHPNEASRQRQVEAMQTIKSAFSRPRRSFTRTIRLNAQVPNAAREKLFQMHETSTVRVLEGLRMAGIQPGQVFTTKQALQLLQGRVGRDSVYHALKASAVEGEPIFERQNPPLDTPKRTANADYDMSKGQPKNAFLVGQKNQEKPNGGRPTRIFTMPSNIDLCRKLKVKLTWSDLLTEDDLTSAKQTRMAAHRELIKRRSGMYSRRWLAHRLGISTNTLDSYNQEIPIHVRHCYYEKPIIWHKLHELPLALDIAGTFLEDETGKRYPVKREIAQKLLAQKHRVTYKRQEVNYYWYVEPSEQNAELPTASIHKTLPPVGFNRSLPQSTPWPAASKQGDWRLLTIPIETTKETYLPSTKSKAIYRDQVAETRIAGQVYQTVALLSNDKAQRISKGNAHRLVETYGAAAVEQALKKLKWYAGKGKVQKPAGFLITTSRLAWRELHGGGGGGGGRRGGGGGGGVSIK